jgi:hypothetical protein
MLVKTDGKRSLVKTQLGINQNIARNKQQSAYTCQPLLVSAILSLPCELSPVYKFSRQKITPPFFSKPSRSRPFSL